MNQFADAHPRKRFFLQMFTRDIALEDTVLDLIDNSNRWLDQEPRTGYLAGSSDATVAFISKGQTPSVGALQILRRRIRPD